MFLLENFPSKGFCFKLSSSKKIENFVSSIFSLVNYLQKHQIAHNIYVTRAKTINSEEVYDDVRAYVWARKSHVDVKDTTLFNPAVCELFGHISIKSSYLIELIFFFKSISMYFITISVYNALCFLFLVAEEAYQNLTEATIAKILDYVTKEPYLLIKKDLHKII